MRFYLKANCTVAILVMFSLFASKVLANTFDEISNKVCLDLWRQISPSTKYMDQWIATQEDKGGWGEFSYGKLTSEESDNNQHMFRIWNLAKEVTNQGSPNYLNVAYLNSIQKGLKYWYDSETQDSNWWDNQINYPQKIGEILLLLRTLPSSFNKYDKALESQLLKLFKPRKIEELSSYGKGANMIDFALHYIYRGVLLEDMEILVQTTRFITANLQTNIQQDFSFHEHGPQMQIASYGLEFSKGMVKIMYYLRGTEASVDLSSKNVNEVLSFIKKTQLRSYWGSNWDYSVVGRGISRPNGTIVSNEDMEMIKKLILIDEKSKEVYEEALNSIVKPNRGGNISGPDHIYYWKSDYTQHYGKDYCFNVRCVSERTIETETRNGENIKGNNLTYGANFISIHGDEYENIMPTWDWAMIPGTTAVWTRTFPLRGNKKDENFGTDDFVGGVSDSQYGVSAMVIRKAEFRAKKGWFFFENEVVCLGSGIENYTKSPLRTTINQCLGEDSFKFWYKEGSKVKKVQGNGITQNFDDKLNTIVHDEIGYFFPIRQNVKVDLTNKIGNWKSINRKESNLEVENRVFKLWIEHEGVEEVDNYQYVVIPNASKKALKKYIKEPVINIISNTERVQAVYQSSLGILQVIFYEPGRLTFSKGWIEVDKPCIIMLNKSKEVYLADPTQKEEFLKVRLGIGDSQYSFDVNFADATDKGQTLKKCL